MSGVEYVAEVAKDGNGRWRWRVVFHDTERRWTAEEDTGPYLLRMNAARAARKALRRIDHVDEWERL